MIVASASSAADEPAGRSGMFAHSSWTVPSFPPLIGPNNVPLPDLHPHLVQIFVFSDTITAILVQDRSQPAPDAQARLLATQQQLSDFYGELPAELRFQASNLQMYATISQGAAFILLHVSCPDQSRGQS
jgi:hypothetical protein